MSKQRINVGTGVNTGTGDTLRSAMEKCNNNFDELYDLIGQDSTGKSIDISGNTISSTFTNTDINISPNGTGDVVIDSDLAVNTIKPNDSTPVTINDGLNVNGTVTSTYMNHRYKFINSTYTMLLNETIFTKGGITVTLPAGETAGDQCSIYHGGGGTLTVNGGGSASTASVERLTFIYDGSSFIQFIADGT